MNSHVLVVRVSRLSCDRHTTPSLDESLLARLPAFALALFLQCVPAFVRFCSEILLKRIRWVWGLG
jgi:hypothetical protein